MDLKETRAAAVITDDVRTDIDRLKDRYRSLPMANLKRLRASPVSRVGTRSDLALDELIAEREPGELRQERIKLVTQIANKPEPPRDEDRDFWDVMDEEYESNIRQFESPKGSPDQGRPVGPDDGFWLAQILCAPEDPKQPYFDPIAADQLTSEYAAVLARSNAPMDKIAELSKAFHASSPLAKQQALRLSRDYVSGNIPADTRARMEQVEVLNAALDYVAITGAERLEVEQMFYAASDTTRHSLIAAYQMSGPTRDAAGSLFRAIHATALRSQVTALARQPLGPLPVSAPNVSKGPDLYALLQQAAKKDQKRKLYSKY